MRSVNRTPFSEEGGRGAIEALKDGAIDRDEHDYALWEKRVDALMVLASSKGYFTVDGLRRVLEDMGPNAFETQTYYERWVQSVTTGSIRAHPTYTQHAHYLPR